ncbi:MAG: hypothetical protein HYT76_05155 [Deltaproteobacteria bacterium]|nr:hypothetical protein [Deltaproteobacteria bacterium]
MSRIRLALATALLGTLAGCFRFETGNPPTTTPEKEYRKLKPYPLGSGNALVAINSDPTNVLVEVIGPCESDAEASAAAMRPDEIAEFVCGKGKKFRITSPVRDFFQLQTTCHEGRFQQLIGRLCQLPPLSCEPNQSFNCP